MKFVGSDLLRLSDSLSAFAAGGGTGWQVSASGTGASQNITLTEAVAVTDVLVFVNGVYQRPTTDYTISGTTLTLTSYANGDPIYIIKPSGAAGAAGLQGWSGGIDGLMADGEIINLGFAPVAITITQANCAVWALTGATGSTVLTLNKKTTYNASPVTVLTATFAAAGQGGPAQATIAVSNATVEAGASLYWTGPGTADATLANLNYLVR